MDYPLSLPTHLLITGFILAVLALVFIFWFGIPALRQWLQLSRVLKALKGSKLENVRTPQALDMAFPEKGELAHLWREYKKTLYPMTGESNDGIATVRWASTAPGEVIWNSQLAVDQRVNAEFFKHLPGIFTGMGIIGTFFGLIEGLRTFRVSSDADVVRSSLESLMHSVGEAFWISAIAISLAIFVTLVEKFFLTTMNGKVDAIAANLDRRFQAAVAEKYLEMTANHTEEAATQLKHLKGELLKDLRPLLQELSDKHSQTLERLATGLQDRFIETTRAQIEASQHNSDALGKSLSGAITTSLTGPMNDIKTAVQQASGDQSASAVKMLQDVMTSFGQKLNDLFGGQITGINELNQQTAQTMQDAVTKLNELVMALQDAGKRSSDSMAEQMAKAINDMGTRQEIITANTQALVAQLREAIIQSQQTTSEGVRSTTDEMARRMAEAIEKMEQRQDSINERTREFVDQIKALVASSQNETSAKVQLTLQTLGEQLGEMLKRFQTAQNDAIETGRKREEDASGRTQATVAGLAGSVEALIQQIAQASTKMGESISVLSSTTTTAISGLNEGATQVNTASRNFTSASEKVTGAMNQATSLTTKLTSLSGDMAVAATSLQQGIQDYKAHRDTMGKLVSDLNGLVANASADVSITSDVLRRIEAATKALGNAQGQTEQFMNGVATVLAKAHESFREAMLKTVRENNHEFHAKLSSAVALLGNSIKELDDVLSTATPTGRSK
ncbi:anti-phage ZorAB system protein ZorA [Limnohabitans sp. DM1]|uniref:anti-phage ZorAB system protein ZorA n=1 Tax=Limnohabitans sp. DM1 TaxID=1597955 RepID=UPI000A49AB37|nr:anti-phage ZorAB system protein ZorA [Limnohabitans sp. DM1]